MSEEKFLATLLEAEDGSGELILQFPPELIAQLGWGIGDPLSFEVVRQAIILKRLPKREANRTEFVEGH